ncbi:MAG: hypothetical protein R3320_00555 [Nitriliruptorales bacterium]|nr:hypothetical protein [Nitriliruptorales bacterium]
MRTIPARDAEAETRFNRVMLVVAIAIGAFLLFATMVTITAPRPESPFDASLPNPMGGPARTAPGDASGVISLGDLTIDGAEIAMGDVGLGVTFVPDWEISNPTGEAITITVGQPQVIEGCCPGPVYADGELTQAGQELTVPARGMVRLQFPLQMHPGMDGPHHLTIPLTSGDQQTAVHVTGNFTALA